jgi:hypothetical protein
VLVSDAVVIDTVFFLQYSFLQYSFPPQDSFASVCFQDISGAETINSDTFVLKQEFSCEERYHVVGTECGKYNIPPDLIYLLSMVLKSFSFSIFSYVSVSVMLLYLK